MGLCSHDKSVCPTAKDLSKIQALGFWGEGVQGKLHLEIQSVTSSSKTSSETSSKTSSETSTETTSSSLIGAAATRISTAPPTEYNTCKGPIQSNLRYNVSSLGNDYITAPVALNKDETLADATCCDSRVNNYAEPRFLFESPYVGLYSKMNQKDTNEHGWPSFRPDEIHLKNFNQTKWSNGDHVYSHCGTHLGSFLPDITPQYPTGDRWCMDVSCLSGNPM